MNFKTCNQIINNKPEARKQKACPAKSILVCESPQQEGAELPFPEITIISTKTEINLHK